MTEWYETAQPGDMFTDEDGCVMVVVGPWQKTVDDLYQLPAAFENASGIWWYSEDELAASVPGHVANMRRHVAGSLRGGFIQEVERDGVPQRALWCHQRGMWKVVSLVTQRLEVVTNYYDTPEQAAEALIPADWQPLGGGA